MRQLVVPVLHPMWFHSLVSSPKNCWIQLWCFAPLDHHILLCLHLPCTLPWLLGHHHSLASPLTYTPLAMNTQAANRVLRASNLHGQNTIVLSLLLWGAISYSHLNSHGCFCLRCFILMLGLLAIQGIKPYDLGYKSLCCQWPSVLQSLHTTCVNRIHMFRRGKIRMEKVSGRHLQSKQVTFLFSFGSSRAVFTL